MCKFYIENAPLTYYVEIILDPIINHIIGSSAKKKKHPYNSASQFLVCCVFVIYQYNVTKI